MNNFREHLALLVDYTALIYHEARNVRHLIHAQAIAPDSWKYLVALPINRIKAWEEIQSIRSKAKKAQTVREVLLPFERRFKVTLEQLNELYDHPSWRSSAYGGNAWKRITELVLGLANALDKGDSEEVTRLLTLLSQANHNNGSVASKLRQLDEAIQ